MAKFRQGDIVLQSSQKLIQGSVDVIDSNGDGNLFSLKFTSGQRIYGFDVDGTLSSDSDTRVATQKAVKTYVDAAIGGSVPPGTDESLVRYHGTNSVQDSQIFIDDLGNMTGVNDLVASGDMTCNDIYVSDSSIYVGTGEIKSTNGNIELYDDGIKRFQTGGAGINVYGDTAPNITFYEGTQAVSSCFTWSDNFYVRTGGQTTGAWVYLQAWNGSSYESLFTGTQGGQAVLFYNGIAAVGTTANGVAIYDTSGDDPILSLRNDAYNEVAKLQIVDGHLYLDTGAQTAGGVNMYLRGWNGSSYDTFIRATQGSAVNLFHANAQVAATNAYGLTMGRVTLTNSSALAWENGTNWITHNDGGGNVQIRFGHHYDTVDAREEFTHGGTAFYIGGSLDSPAGTMQMKVASNGGAGSGSQVTWNNALTFNANDTITYSGEITASKIHGAVWG